MNYKFYVVLDGAEKEIEITGGSASESDTQQAIEAFSKCESVWIGLADGSMLAVPKASMSRIHFVAKPVKE